MLVRAPSSVRVLYQRLASHGIAAIFVTCFHDGVRRSSSDDDSVWHHLDGFAFAQYKTTVEMPVTTAQILMHFLQLTIVTSLFLAFAVGQNVNDLRRRLTARGVSVLLPTDAGYAAESQAYNRRFTVQPIAITFPTTAQQVSAVVKAGVALNLRVVARSGGHNYLANGLGGTSGALVVDTRRLSKFKYNSVTTRATIQTGLRLGDIALALNANGRAIPHGRCTYVGLGGHVQGGGWGFTSRMWGLNLDVVQSITAVLANGTITTASQTVNSDLFWALRGAGSSFGIITSIEVKTFPAPDATIFRYFFNNVSITTAAATLVNFQSFVDSGIPARLGGQIVITRGGSRGTVNLRWFGGFYGDQLSFNDTIAPFLNNFPFNTSSVTSGNWLTGLQAYVVGALNTSTSTDTTDTFYAKSLLTPQSAPITLTAFTAFITHLANDGFAYNGNWFVEVETYGGSNSAVNAVPLDATAYAHRSSRFNFQLYASSPGAVPPFPADGFTFVDGMASSIVNNMPANWDYGTYINYPDDQLVDWQQRYYGTHYQRLRTLKTQLDGNDVFDFPLAIEEL